MFRLVSFPFMTDPNTKRCRFCAETIHADAKKCKHCGETLEGTNESGKKPIPTLGLGMVFGWLFGLLFLLTAISSIVESVVHALLWLLLACICLPPVIRAIEKKLGFHLSRSMKVAVVLIGFVAIGSTSDLGSSPMKTAGAPAKSEPQLELQALNFRKEYSFDKVSGSVKNLTNENLSNVQAVANFYDKNDTFVKSADALIDYNPILPGQISPFTVLTTGNPEIQTVRVDFKHLLGGTIPYRDVTK